MYGKYVTDKQVMPGGQLAVHYSNDSTETHNMVELGVAWFKMSNDTFCKVYGFNFNPHEYPGLYEKCRKIVYPNEGPLLRSAT